MFVLIVTSNFTVSYCCIHCYVTMKSIILCNDLYGLVAWLPYTFFLLALTYYIIILFFTFSPTLFYNSFILYRAFSSYSLRFKKNISFLSFVNFLVLTFHLTSLKPQDYTFYYILHIFHRIQKSSLKTPSQVKTRQTNQNGVKYYNKLIIQITNA